jgi:dihydrofolate reductase
MLNLIVALDKSRVIGLNGRLPWKLSNDLKRFKLLTLGYPVIMGRKTFESIGRALPARQNIVLTRNSEFSAEGVDLFCSLEQALDSFTGGKNKEIFIIGGAEIYSEGLARADRIYLTEVEANVDGDTCFPELSADDWVEIDDSGLFAADDRHTYPYRFRTLERRDVSK